MTQTLNRTDTREAWLNEAVELLKPLFAEIDVELPPVRVSIGWPSRGGTGSKKKVIGQCWKASVAGDGVSQLFISPVLGGEGDEDGLMIQLVGVLIHELIHAVDDCESGHKGEFAKMARAIGLEGKMTATSVSGRLADQLKPILADLGPLPHSALNPFAMEEQRPKQPTRMLKIVCPADGYTARTTRKWLDELGAPRCPCGLELEEETA